MVHLELRRLGIFDKSLVFFLLIMLLANVPVLSPNLVFVHDTLGNFIFFQYAYSEISLHNEFPKWVPLMGYGVPFDIHLLLSLVPTDYVVMACGWLLGIKNALLLFKVSAILSQGIFILGVYALARKLCDSMAAVCMICLGAILTNSWTYNYQWNFTSYYLMPLVLYFLLDFLEGGQPRQLWRAAILETLSLIGTIPYIAPLHLLILTTFLLPFVCRRPALMLRFLHGRTLAQPLFLVFVVALLLIGSLAFGMEAAIIVAGRDEHSGHGPVSTFVELDRYPYVTMTGVLLVGDVPLGDMVCFVGILPLATIIYALSRRRDPAFLAMAGVALVIFWFAQGGWFTRATYYCLPLMKMFRHIGAAMNLCRVFLLLAAGMGFDTLLADLRGRSAENAAPWRGARVIMLLIASTWFLDLIFNLRSADLNNRHFPSVEDFGQSEESAGLLLRFLINAGVFAGLLAVIGRMRAAGPDWPRRVAYAFLIVYVADVGYYQVHMVRELPFSPPMRELDETMAVSALRYKAQRCFTQPRSILGFAGPVAEDCSMPSHAVGAFKVLMQPRGRAAIGPAYASWDLLARCDHVAPVLKLDVVMPGVKKMIEARGGTLPGLPAFILPRDMPFLESLGFERDKIRIVRNVTFAKDEASAVRLFESDKNPQDNPVLIGTEISAGSDKVRGEFKDEVRVDDSSFSANRMVLHVSARGPGWLYCADAYHPGWKATVKGQPAEVYRANLGFKAVHLDEGESDVVFNFDGGMRDVVRAGVALFAAGMGFILTAYLLLCPWGKWASARTMDSALTAAAAEFSLRPIRKILRFWSVGVIVTLLMCAVALFSGNDKLFVAAALLQLLVVPLCWFGSKQASVLAIIRQSGSQTKPLI